MHDLPHTYRVTAKADSAVNVELASPGLPGLSSAPPAEFGGPGDRWSPETLLVAAVADCFVLSFKAIARASKLDWTSLNCSVEGVLERVERSTMFTAFRLAVELYAPDGTDERRARLLLDKAEQSCLITNSLKSTCHLEVKIRVG